MPPAQRRVERQSEAVRVQTEALTLGEWAQTWLAALEADPRRSPATVVSYRSVLRNHVLPELGEVRLVDLTTERVAEHLATLARRPSRRHPGARVNGVAPNTVIVLRSMLNAAVKAKAAGLERFEFPAAPKHRRVRPEDEHGDVASPEQVRAFTEAMPPHLQIAIRSRPGAPCASGSCWGCSAETWSTWTTPDGRCCTSAGSGTSRPTL